MDVIIFHTTLYRCLKLTYSTNVGGIVMESQIMSEMGTGSLRQSVDVLLFADFFQSVLKF